jgi:hypothetical protein
LHFILSDAETADGFEQRSHEAESHMLVTGACLLVASLCLILVFKTRWAEVKGLEMGSVSGEGK